MKRLLLLAALLLANMASSAPAPGNRFVYTVLKHPGLWDPYGNLWPALRAKLIATTSLDPWPDRRVIEVGDPLLFESPFLLLTGRGSFSFSDEEVARLRRYLESGGFLLIDNAEADARGPFARSVGALGAKLDPDKGWEPLSPDHAVDRSFFLLREIVGRRAGSGLEGLEVGGRTAAVYAADDLHGPWVTAPAGGFLFPCSPGGEQQRRDAFKALVNVIVFSVTGTYKADAVHQRYLQQKLSVP